MFKPLESWAEFAERHQPGRQPSIANMIARWEEWVVGPPDPAHPERLGKRTPKGVGEQNLYSAWLLEEMDAEEAKYFALYLLQPSKLIMLALVPEVRNSIAVDQAEADLNAEILEEMNSIKEALKTIGLEVGSER